jgi:CBS domain-containing protein
MQQTRVYQLMTPFPVFVSPFSSLQEAARLMRNRNCGILPVGTPEEVLGVLTDRDIVVRALAESLDPASERAGDHMTDAAYTCHRDDTLEQAANLMNRHQVSRVLVKDDDQRIVGILSFGCILRKDRNMREVADVVALAVAQ